MFFLKLPYNGDLCVSLNTLILDDALKFEFGSHHGGLKLLKERKQKIFLHDSKQVASLKNYFKGMTLNDFETQWIECHSEELQYQSGFQTERLLATVCYISPLNEKIENIFDFM